MVCLNLCLVDNRAIRVAIRWAMCYCAMAGLSRKKMLVGGMHRVMGICKISSGLLLCWNDILLMKQ